MKSRKIKENRRKIIRLCKAKYGVESIHEIWDDFYYWSARDAWEKLHNGKIYEPYLDIQLWTRQ